MYVLKRRLLAKWAKHARDRQWTAPRQGTLSRNRAVNFKACFWDKWCSHRVRRTFFLPNRGKLHLPFRAFLTTTPTRGGVIQNESDKRGRSKKPANISSAEEARVPSSVFWTLENKAHLVALEYLGLPRDAAASRGCWCFPVWFWRGFLEFCGGGEVRYPLGRLPPLWLSLLWSAESSAWVVWVDDTHPVEAQ